MNFATELDELISQQIETYKNNLAYGMSVQTIEQYRETVGKIAGLQMALDFFEEAQAAADKGR